MIKKVLTLALLAAVVAGSVTVAEARPHHWRHHWHHWHHHHWRHHHWRHHHR